MVRPPGTAGVAFAWPAAGARRAPPWPWPARSGLGGSAPAAPRARRASRTRTSRRRRRGRARAASACPQRGPRPTRERVPGSATAASRLAQDVARASERGRGDALAVLEVEQHQFRVAPARALSLRGSRGPLRCPVRVLLGALVGGGRFALEHHPAAGGDRVL